jgi:ADP-ribose pyrophosphatase
MKIISSKVVYTCPILRVEERHIMLPDKVEQTHWIVVRQPNVTIVALTPHHEIVLIQENRGKNDTSTMELPGGKINSFNPSPDEAKKVAQQELESETGYTARNLELLEIFEPVSNWYERKYYHFVAWNLKHIGQKLEDGENIQVILKPVNEAHRKAKKGLLTFGDENEAVKKAIDFFKLKKII